MSRRKSGRFHTGQDMFFLLRCVFWLTVLFTAIFSQDPPRQRAQRQEQAIERPQAPWRIGELAQSWLNSVVSVVGSKVAGHCGNVPSDCVALAKELSDIAVSRRSASKEVPAEPIAAQAVPQVFAHVPLPPRRPRISVTAETATTEQSGLEKTLRGEYLIAHSGRS